MTDALDLVAFFLGAALACTLTGALRRAEAANRQLVAPERAAPSRWLVRRLEAALAAICLIAAGGAAPASAAPVSYTPRPWRA